MEVNPQLTEVAMVAVTVEATGTLRDQAANPPGGSLLGVLGPPFIPFSKVPEKGFKFKVLDNDTTWPTLQFCSLSRFTLLSGALVHYCFLLVPVLFSEFLSSSHGRLRIPSDRHHQSVECAFITHRGDAIGVLHPSNSTL